MSSIQRQAQRVITASLALSMLTSVSAGPLAQAQSTPSDSVRIGAVRMPDTKELVEFSFQPTPPEKLKQITLAKMRTDLERQVSSICSSGKKISAGDIVMDFGVEFAAFSTAVSLNSQIHTENDPAALKHMVESQFLDPMSYASFAAFLAGSKGMHSLLQAAGAAYDPCRMMKAGRFADRRLQTPPRTEVKTRQTYIKADVVDGKTGKSFAQMNIPGRVERFAEMKPDTFNTRVQYIPEGPTRFQKLFSPMMGPLGLGAGLFLSNIVHELATDPDLALCSKSKVSASVPADQAAAACEKAWENWKLSKKALDYTPDILSMGLASLAQAYVVNKFIFQKAMQPFLNQAPGIAHAAAQKAGVKVATTEVVTNYLGERAVLPLDPKNYSARVIKKGAERYVPLVLRGFRFAGALGGALSGTGGRILTSAVNIAIFMEIVHPITPMIKQPFERRRQGTDITSTTNELISEIARAEANKWNWKPRPESDFCPDVYAIDGDMASMYLDGGSGFCSAPEQISPSVALKKLGEKNKKWREFVLQEPLLAHKNWTDYSSRFVTAYGNAYNFYSDILTHLNFQKFDPTAETEPSNLFVAHPFFGIESVNAGENENAREKAIVEARTWLESYLRNPEKVKSTQKSSLTDLYRILRGLKATDMSIPLKTIAPQAVGFRAMDKLSENERAAVEANARSGALADAIRLLRSNLATNQLYTDQNVPFPSTAYERQAEGNPFMKLRLLLGNPDPQPEGLAYLKKFNEDPVHIAPDSQHPDGIGRARTSTVTDYLLASMVCGPEVESSASAMKVIDNQKSESYLKSLFSHLWVTGKMATNARTSAVVVDQPIDQIPVSLPEASMIRPGKNDGTIFSEWKSVRVDFHPPRIIKNLGTNFCDSIPQNLNRDKVFFNIHEGQWNVGGERVTGFLNLVKKHVRDSMMYQAMPADKMAQWDDPFQAWWQRNIEPSIKEAVTRIRGNYRDLLVTKYIPSMLSKETKTYGGRTFPLGALESMRQEAKFNLLIIGKTLTGDKKTVSDLAEQLMADLDQMGAIATDLSVMEKKGSQSQAQYNEVKARYATTLKLIAELPGSLSTVAKDSSKEKAPVSNLDDRAQIQQAAFQNLAGLIEEMDSYFGLVRGVQLVGQ